MYTGRNPIAWRSQEWLSKALIALLAEKPYAKISVKEICAAADLSRQTFYQFFANKDEVLRYALHRFFATGLEQLGQREYASVDEVAVCFFRFLREREAYLRPLLDNHLEYILLDELQQTMNRLATQLAPGQNARALSHGNAFLSGGLLCLLVYWLQSPERLSEEEMAVLLLSILSGNYFTPPPLSPAGKKAPSAR